VGRPNARLPERASRPKPPSAAPAVARVGAWINQGYGVTGAYSGHDVEGGIELPGGFDLALYAPTLTAPDSCVESSTAHWRYVSYGMTTTAHGHGFWDACSSTWAWFAPLDATFRERYVRTFDNEERLFTEVVVSGGISYGLLYNFEVGSWVTQAWVFATRSAPGWAQHEPINLELAGCPTLPPISSRWIQVYNGSTWALLQAPIGATLKTGPCSAAYYKAQYGEGYAEWTVSRNTPTWLMPFAGGQARTITCMPGDGAEFGCNHTNGQNRDAYDFAAPFGSDFVASRAGTVAKVVNDKPDTGGGLGDENYVFLSHTDGKHSLYIHHKQYSAYVTTPGQTVRAGQPLAQIGTSGLSTGPHLHFVVNTGFCGTVFCDSVPIQFDDIAPARGSSVVSDNWAQP
jgi:hypothetical protein